MTTPITITTSADALSLAIASLNTNQLAAIINWADTSAPTSPSNGQSYIDNTVATRLVGKLRQNGAWVSMILTHILEEALNCDDNELQSFIIHKLATGSLPAASAGNEGKLAWDTTLERAYLAGSAVARYVAECNADGTTYVRLPASLNVAGLGNPATANTGTLLGGWQLDAAIERLNVVAAQPVPAGWTAVIAGAKDITLEVECLLLAAETANDDINIGCTWQSITTGAAPGDDTLAATDASQDIASGNGQYDRHIVSVTLDYDGLVANVAAGDTLAAVIDHDIAAGGTPVAGVIVTNAWFKVPVVNFNS